MSIFHVSKLKKKENIWKDWKGKGKKRAERPKKERHEKFYFPSLQSTVENGSHFIL